MHTPESGEVRSDKSKAQCFDLAWMCPSVVVGIRQEWGVDAMLEGKTVRENMALGLAGVSNEEVAEPCRGVMLDEFVRGVGGRGMRRFWAGVGLG